MSPLKKKLTLSKCAGKPDSDIRQYREALCLFLREVEYEVFETTEEEKKKIRLLLGWDDFTFQRFIDTPIVTHSSPHASMNIFAPNFAHPWLHSAIQMIPKNCVEGIPVHLRTLVTHNNLGDQKYKTYAWWHRLANGQALQTSLFSRNHKTRHQTLLSQPIPSFSREGCHLIDFEALQLASKGTNYAYFCMIYRTAIEWHAGLHNPHGLLEIPLNILNAFTFQSEKLEQWNEIFGQITGDIVLRSTNNNGELFPMPLSIIKEFSPSNLRNLKLFPLMTHNFMSFAQIYLLGISSMTGGAKMASYTPQMNRLIAEFFDRLGRRNVFFPDLIPLTLLPLEQVMPIDSITKQWLIQKNILGCLSIGVCDHGKALRKNLDSLLPVPYEQLFKEIKNEAT